MENYQYSITYLTLLSRNELLSLMVTHDYEQGYEEFSDSELIEQLSSIVLA